MQCREWQASMCEGKWAGAPDAACAVHHDGCGGWVSVAQGCRHSLVPLPLQGRFCKAILPRQPPLSASRRLQTCFRA